MYTAKLTFMVKKAKTICSERPFDFICQFTTATNVGCRRTTNTVPRNEIRIYDVATYLRVSVGGGYFGRGFSLGVKPAPTDMTV